MIRKFKCLSCGNTFQADDRNQVTCPKCHSDNVTPVNNKMKAMPLVVACVFLLSVGGGFLVKKCIGGDIKRVENKDTVEIEDNVEDTIVIDTTHQSDIVPSIEIKSTAPVWDKGIKAYHFSVRLLPNIPETAEVELKLTKDDEGKEVIAISKDGKFTGVKPSMNSVHSYFVHALVKADGKLLVGKTEVVGFMDVPEIQPHNKITKQRLQSMINNKDASLMGDNNFIAPNVKIHATGLREGDHQPTNFQRIFTNIFNLEYWKSVVVTNVGYDDVGRVNSVTISVNYPD